MNNHETAQTRKPGRQPLPLQNVSSLKALAAELHSAADKISELADALQKADPTASIKVEYYASLVDGISAAESFKLDGQRKIHNKTFTHVTMVPAKRGRPKKDAK
jgi:uncharacterized phage infection (PIP) family protein YhgE